MFFRFNDRTVKSVLLKSNNNENSGKFIAKLDNSYLFRDCLASPTQKYDMACMRPALPASGVFQIS